LKDTPASNAGYHLSQGIDVLRDDDRNALLYEVHQGCRSGELLILHSGMDVSRASGKINFLLRDDWASISEVVMNANNNIRILIVDDHPVLREGIAAILNNERDMVLVAEASDGREAIERFRTHCPDITLMDLRMPVMDGTDAIVSIRQNFPSARIIVFTTFGGYAQAIRAFKAGASGYLLKNMLRKELIETIRSVHNGKRGIPPEVAMEMAEHHADDALTQREVEVLKQVSAGNSNKIVADHLQISEETVKAHMRNILSKLCANDRTHAVTIALKRGIIDI